MRVSANIPQRLVRCTSHADFLCVLMRNCMPHSNLSVRIYDYLLLHIVYIITLRLLQSLVLLCITLNVPCTEWCILWMGATFRPCFLHIISHLTRRLCTKTLCICSPHFKEAKVLFIFTHNIKYLGAERWLLDECCKVYSLYCAPSRLTNTCAQSHHLFLLQTLISIHLSVIIIALLSIHLALNVAYV